MSSTPMEELQAQNESLKRRLISWVNARGRVWIVRYSNYEPAEVDSIWLVEDLAKKRRDSLNEEYESLMWEIEQWNVGEREEPET